MFSAEILRELNTLYGFTRDGELLCAPCGFNEPLSERGETISGVDLFNAGASIDDEWCSGCGEEFPCLVHPTARCERWVCDGCGETLKSKAER